MAEQNTPPTPAAPKPIEATTSPTLKLRVGSVASFGVRTSGVKPTIQGPDGPPLFVARDGSGAWVGSWVPTAAGEHVVTASVPDATPVTFTITATDPEA
jgi:hypothetical protein